VKFVKILWRGEGEKEMDGRTLRHSGEAKHTTHQTPLERSKFLIRRETRCQLQSGDCYAGSVLKIFPLHHESIISSTFYFLHLVQEYETWVED
jgi:hypothetical protein